MGFQKTLILNTLALYILLFPIIGFGQDNIPSVKDVDWKSLTPSKSQVELDVYYEFLDKYQDWDLLEQETYLKEGVKAAKSLNNDEIGYKFIYQLGNLYLSVDSLFKALSTFNTALEYDIEEGTKANTYNMLGFTFSELEDYQTALAYYFKAVEIEERINPAGMSYIFINISSIYRDLEDYDNAIKYNWYANSFSQNLPLSEKEYIALFNYTYLSQIYSKINQLDSSEYYIDLALSTLVKVDSINDFSMLEAKKMTLVRAIETYLNLGMYEQAHEYLQKIKAYKLTYYKFFAIILEAEYEIQEGNFRSALNVLGQIDFKSDNTIEQEKIILLSIDCYKGLGNNAKIVEQYNQLVTLQKEKAKSDRIRVAALADIKYETFKKNEQIKALQLNQKINRTINVGAVIIVLLLAGWSFFIFRNNQQRKAQNQLLLENQKTIEDQASKLQILYDYKNKLFANIAHELRTPLTLIANPIKSVLQRNDIKEQDIQQLRIADRNIRSLSSTIHQILDLAKREKVELAIQPIQFNINELIQYIANDFYSMSQFKSIQLTKPTIGLAIPVITDGEKLMIVIRNLLSNAFKFTPQNGQVSINVIDLGKEVTINIQDTGKGIAKADLEKIFDRHFQVNPANLPNEGGMGIGLSICKEYMTLINGSIMAESQLGQGSSFTFRFPKNLVEQEEVNTEASDTFNALINQNSTIDFTIHQEKLNVSSEETKNEVFKILIAEDNVDMSNYLNTILSEEYELIFAQDGEQALQLLENNRPNLIISDYMMPNMDGMEFVEQLKSKPEFAGIPVIMLTAQQAMNVKLSALRIGVDDYLTKPFDNRELFARINNILSNQNVIKAEQQTATNETTAAVPLMNLEDLAWLEELENKAKQYISNPDFTITHLAEEMAMSYSNIFRKIKKLTGLTANKYLQEIKFQEARKLLEARKYGSVKAVSYSVGYKNVRYFSKNFKQRFGKNPSEYLV